MCSNISVGVAKVGLLRLKAWTSEVLNVAFSGITDPGCGLGRTVSDSAAYTIYTISAPK